MLRARRSCVFFILLVVVGALGALARMYLSSQHIPAQAGSASRMNNYPSPRPPFMLLSLLAPREKEPQPALPLFPAGFANWIGTSMLRGVDALARASNGLMERLSKRRTGPGEPQPSPSYLEAQLGLDHVDAAQLVKGLKIPLPFPLAGRLSFRAQVAFPLDKPHDLKSYRVQGTVSSRSLVLAGQELEGLRARVAYSDGVLRLEELSGRIPPPTDQRTASPKAGSFHGTAQLQLLPSGDLIAHLRLEGVPFARAFAFLPPAKTRARGLFSGEVEVRIPANQLENVAEWNASGTITAQHLELYGWALKNITLLLRIHQGRAFLQVRRCRLAETPLTVSAELLLANAYPFTAKARVQKADLAALQRLYPGMTPVSIRGQLDAAATIHGSLSPFVFQSAGRGSAENLSIDRLKFGTLGFRWEGDCNRIRVNDLQACLYRGELAGSAVLPLRAAVAGHVEICLQDVDVGALSRDLPHLSIPLEGRATGRLDGTLSAAEEGGQREFTSKLRLQAPNLRVHGIATDDLHGSVEYRNQALRYYFEAETLAGQFHLQGQLPVTECSL